MLASLRQEKGGGKAAELLLKALVESQELEPVQSQGAMLSEGGGRWGKWPGINKASERMDVRSTWPVFSSLGPMGI